VPAVGFDFVCMEARQVKAALSAMQNKTDILMPPVSGDRDIQDPPCARSNYRRWSIPTNPVFNSPHALTTLQIQDLITGAEPPLSYCGFSFVMRQIFLMAKRWSAGKKAFCTLQTSI